MYLKEYRICMPLTVEEYKIGQLYMIAKHSHEQSEKGEGVEVVTNEPCEHPEYGNGQYTEKRIHLSSRLPGWVQSLIPRIFYVTERAWNFFPHTITEYTCSFLPKFSVYIETRYENNGGTSENIHKKKREQPDLDPLNIQVVNLESDDLEQREVDVVDIVMEEIAEHHYKPEEDLKIFKSEKTERGPYTSGWMESSNPIMCSYKVVKVKFEVWGLQTKVEQFGQKAIRDILLLGHRQAFAWIDEWYGMSLEDLREYETRMQAETNKKLGVEAAAAPQ